MDNNLPFPETRNGWVASLLLMIILMLLYYLIPYKFLRDTYSNRHVFSAFNIVDETKSNTRDSSLSSVEIYADIPDYINNYGVQPLYLRLKYSCASLAPLTNLRVSMLDDTNQFSRLLLLPGMTENQFFGNSTEEQVFSNSIEVKALAPCEQSLLRMSFIPSVERFDIGNMRLLITDDTQSQFREPSKSGLPTPDLGGEISTVVVASMLLPPWANGFIPLFAIIVSYICEKSHNEKSLDKISLDGVIDILKGSGLLSLFTCFWFWGFIQSESLLFFVGFPLILFAGWILWKKMNRK